MKVAPEVMGPPILGSWALTYVGNPAEVVVAPKFTGHNSAWMISPCDWQDYVLLMGGRHFVDDEQLLYPLSLCFDEAFKLDLNRCVVSKALVYFN